MKNIKWIMFGAACVLLISFVIGGTFANTEQGEMDIKLIELQRQVQSDESVSADNLEPFVQRKLLIPAVYDALDKAAEPQQWATGGSALLYTDKVKNVVDKFAFVENKGAVPVYVRTWFAFEQGDLTEEEFKSAINLNRHTSAWSWDEAEFNVEIDGNIYVVMLATYNDPLEIGQTTTNPSLLQVLMYNTVSEEISERLDGNGNGTYDIEVCAEAVQYVENKDDIKAFMNSALGTNHPWNGSVESPTVSP